MSYKKQERNASILQFAKSVKVSFDYFKYNSHDVMNCYKKRLKNTYLIVHSKRKTPNIRSVLKIHFPSI